MSSIVWNCENDDSFDKYVVDIIPDPWNMYPNGGAHMCYRNMFPGYYFHAGPSHHHHEYTAIPWYRKD